MGSSQSSQLKTISNLLNQSVTKIINTNKVTNGTFNTNTNTFTLSIGRYGVLNCKNIDLSQSITSSQKVVLSNTINNKVDLQNILKGAVSDVIAQKNDSVNSFLSTAFTNQSNSTDIEKNIKNIIETNITDENVTECNSILDNANKGIIIVDGQLNCDNLKNPQEIISEQFVNAIVNAGSDALLKNTEIANAVNKIEQNNSNTNKGPLDFLTSGSGSLLYIIVGIIVIIIICVIIYYFYRKNQENKLTSNKTTSFTTKVSRKYKF
jgi:hypothetical protein